MARNNDGNMSREEAGRKGGETTARNHDKEFFQEIGQKGGESRSNNDNSGGRDPGNSGSNTGNSGSNMSREEAGRKGGESRGKKN
jgi:general stress protein YciG